MFKLLVWVTKNISELPTQSTETPHKCITTVTNKAREEIIEKF